jgi:UPF0755 protein
MILFRRISIAFLILVSSVAVAFSFIWWQFKHRPLTVPANDIFYIPPGSSINSIANSLAKQHIIAHPKLFVMLTKVRGDKLRLKAGEYQLMPGMTPDQLLDKVVAGKVYLRRYTLVEGWTLRQVVATINSNPYLTHTIDRMNIEDIARTIGTNQVNFEGYFYPDTYLFAARINDLVVLKQAYWKMKTNLDRLWADRAPDLPYTDPSMALIAASLIEKETAKPDERAKIAGVIVRRLQQNMRLQIDAAVIYGLGQRYTGTLTRENLREDTPFNTYLHDGLPPTPIAMPSIASIKAALHPEPGTELYYVAKGDGSHEFTNTLQDHIDAIKKYHVQHLETAEEESDDDLAILNLPTMADQLRDMLIQ